MSKIGILTYHSGYNYGACLQAFALQTTLSKMGYENEIINFETDRFVASREMFSRRPTRLKEIIKSVSRLPYWNSLHVRQKVFDDFTLKVLKASSRYKSEQEVKDHISDYDCVVCGSDQIWNQSMDDAPAVYRLFYLNFPKTQRRVAYAPSFGEFVKEMPKYEDELLPLIKQFDSVSCREISGVEYLRSKGVDCKLVLDPTVLLDKEDYEPICPGRLVDGKYVLLFSWLCNDNVVSVAKQVSKKLGLPLINIVPPPRAMFKGIHRKLDVGPCEFLSMIKNAEFVVTNSFHGTAFATTFEKNYVSVVSGKPDLRVASLLGQLGLSSHLATKDTLNMDNYINTNYSKVREKKAALRKDSFDYLKISLAGL